MFRFYSDSLVPVANVLYLIIANMLLCKDANYPPYLLCLWLIEGGYDARFDQNLGSLSIKKQMKLKCHGQKLAVARPNIDQGVLTQNSYINNQELDFKQTKCSIFCKYEITHLLYIVLL